MRAALCLALLAGCASDDCAADAFQLGQRDGRLAVQQGPRYVSRCGASFDSARYSEGYQDGFSHRPPPVGRR